MCLIPRSLRKVVNSAEMNCGPLSVVIVMGMPQRAKKHLQKVNDPLCGDRPCRDCLRPLRVQVIGHDEESLVMWDATELTTNVHLDVLPRPSWPLQRLKGRSWCKAEGMTVRWPLATQWSFQKKKFISKPAEWRQTVW